MSELRGKARIFFNALNFDAPVNFGQDELAAGLDADKYVADLHGESRRDPVQSLADQIDLSDSAGAYLFTGNRGTGKTTELLRLATILRRDDYDCEVFYADMSEYLTLTQRIEVTDFLISVLGALSEKVAERFDEDPGKPSFFERVRSFLEFKCSIHRNQSAGGLARIQGRLAAKPDLQGTIAAEDPRARRAAGDAGAEFRRSKRCNMSAASALTRIAKSC